MQGLDLDVLPPSLAVDIPVLDACVRELNVTVVLRQVVLLSPEMNLFRCSIGASIAVGLASIPLMEEPLIVAPADVRQSEGRTDRPARRA